MPRPEGWVRSPFQPCPKEDPEDQVNHFGWQAEGRRLLPPAGPEEGTQPPLPPPPQTLLETPDSQKTNGPTDQLPNRTIS